MPLTLAYWPLPWAAVGGSLAVTVLLLPFRGPDRYRCPAAWAAGAWPRWRAREPRTRARAILAGTESGLGTPTGRTRPLWIAAQRQPSGPRTATMVLRVSRRLGSFLRHAT